MATTAMGPTMAGGMQPIVKDGYELLYLPDVNNDELQKEGQSPVFYWVPNQVRIARKDGPGQGRPAVPDAPLRRHGGRGDRRHGRRQAGRRRPADLHDHRRAARRRPAAVARTRSPPSSRTRATTSGASASARAPDLPPGDRHVEHTIVSNISPTPARACRCSTRGTRAPARRSSARVASRPPAICPRSPRPRDVAGRLEPRPLVLAHAGPGQRLDRPLGPERLLGADRRLPGGDPLRRLPRHGGAADRHPEHEAEDVVAAGRAAHHAATGRRSSTTSPRTRRGRYLWASVDIKAELNQHAHERRHRGRHQGRPDDPGRRGDRRSRSTSAPTSSSRSSWRRPRR